MPADWKIDGMAQSKHEDIHGIAVEGLEEGGRQTNFQCHLLLFSISHPSLSLPRISSPLRSFSSIVYRPSISSSFSSFEILNLKSNTLLCIFCVDLLSHLHALDTINHPLQNNAIKLCSFEACSAPLTWVAKPLVSLANSHCIALSPSFLRYWPFSSRLGG